jgi:hypothetical protein
MSSDLDYRTLPELARVVPFRMTDSSMRIKRDHPVMLPVASDAQWASSLAGSRP